MIKLKSLIKEDRDPELFNFDIIYDIPHKTSANIFYHGTHREAYLQILTDGYLRSWRDQKERTSGGYLHEKGLIWLTSDKKVAFQYAEAWEANMPIGGSKGLEPGGIVEVNLPHDIKLISRYEKLTDKHKEIILAYTSRYLVNNGFAPNDDCVYELKRYLERSVNFDSAVGRLFNFDAEGLKFQWPTMLKIFGYNGIIYDEKQIGVAAEKIPIAGAFRYKKSIK